MKKVCLVIRNPYSGKEINESNLRNKILKTLMEHGYDVIWKNTNYPTHATEIVKNSCDVDLVLSIGGDGTFNEIVAGNEKRDNKLLLSHVPTGTTNDIGAVYGYDGKNLDEVLSGSIKEIDVCTINGIVFTYVAGFGKFMDISYTTSRDNKKALGYFAYLEKAKHELKNLNPIPRYSIACTANGVTRDFESSFLVVTNSPRIAGINGIHTGVKVNDGKIELLSCTIESRRDLISKFIKLATKQTPKDSSFEKISASQITLTFNGELPARFCIDGEPLLLPERKIVFETGPKAKILLPNRPNNLF